MIVSHINDPSTDVVTLFYVIERVYTLYFRDCMCPVEIFGRSHYYKIHRVSSLNNFSRILFARRDICSLPRVKLIKFFLYCLQTLVELD